ATVFVDDIVGDGFFARHIDRAAAPLRGRVGVAALLLFLDLLAGDAAADRARDRGEVAPAAAADLVADRATRDRTDHGTRDLVFVLRFAMVHDLFVMAFLALGVLCLLDRIDADH